MLIKQMEKLLRHSQRLQALTESRRVISEGRLARCHFIEHLERICRRRRCFLREKKDLDGEFDVDEPARALRHDAGSPLGRDSTSVGQPFSFVGRSGREVHGLFYEPTLQGITGPPGTLPPLIVKCHSGPTEAVGAGFDVVTQYFTSRGFAMAAVDYGGSTGYGRAYRSSLWGQWGVVDSEDCVDAARELAARSSRFSDR